MNELDTKQVRWREAPGEFRGEIGAVTRLDGEHWRRAGAHFERIDDAQGETPLLGVGAVRPGAEDEIEFGLLDYEEGGVYLLVPARGEERRALAQEVAKELEAAGLLSVAEDLAEERSSYLATRELSARVKALEQAVGEQLANATVHTVIPVATEVSPLGEETVEEISGEDQVEDPAEHHIGTVHWFNSGIGVISPEDGPGHVYVDVGSLDALAEAKDGRVNFKYSVVSVDDVQGFEKKAYVEHLAQEKLFPASVEEGRLYGSEKVEEYEPKSGRPASSSLGKGLTGKRKSASRRRRIK